MATTTKTFKVTVDTSEATESIEKTTDGVEDLGKQAKKTGDEMKQGFKAAESGAKGAGKGFTSLGGTIGGVAKAFGILAVAFAVLNVLKDLLMSNQRVADTFAKAMVFLEVIFGKVADAVQGLVDGLRALKNIDMASIAEEFKKFGDAMSKSGDDALATAENIVEMMKAVEKAEASQRLFILQQQKEAELQRQIRDDISLTIAVREKANDRLAEILDKQLIKEKSLANQKLTLALLEQDINKEGNAEAIKVIEAKIEIADIEERITGQLSEQKTNREALRQEEATLADERIVGYESALRFLKEASETGILEESLGAVDQQIMDLQSTYVEALRGMRAFLKENNEDLTAEQIENHSEMFRMEEAHQNRVNKLVKKKAKIKMDFQVQLATATSTVLGTIAAAVQDQSKAGVIAAKTLAVAQIAIDTAVAITGAIAQAQSVPYPGNLVAIATGVAAVVAGIASAVTTLNTANVPGGGSAAMPSAPPAVTAPSFAGVTTNTTELGNTEAAELAPVQAYVLETQVTGTQNEVNQIEGQAEFGG